MNMNSRFDNMAVLFLHHSTSDVTMHNYKLLQINNPNKKIYPVGFSWHELMDNSHIVYRRDDEFPNNYVLNHILNSGTSSESDLCIYDFFLHHQNFDSYFVVEWDTYCNSSIEECYGDIINSHDTFSALTFTNEIDSPDVEKTQRRYVKEWSWYNLFESIATAEQKEKLTPYLGGTYPTSLLYYSKKALYDMVELVLNDPRLYDNIQNEMRLGTLLQQAGYKLKEYGSNTNQFFEQDSYKLNIQNNVKGYYHPIKTIL
jgi:hypothetical protein